MDRVPSAGQDTYRLIVTRRNTSEILLRFHGNAWSLPSVHIAQGQRIAEQLGTALDAQCGYRGYCLYVPALAAGLSSCAVMEVAASDEIAPAGNCWKPREVATNSSFVPNEDRILIDKSIEELNSARQRPNEAPFARPGWLSELFVWAKQQLDPLGVRLTGAFTQLNSSPAFSLIRLETHDSAVWFKAAGGPNRHELAVTTCLARLFPRYVPELLGVHTAWNGWLACEASGRTLNHGAELPLWLKAAEDLAQLQIGSIGKQAELLESSCRDLRIPRLVELVDPFVDRTRELMSAQETEMPARLTDTEVTFLGACLKQACSLFAGLDFPDTLGHLDLNPGNIVVSSAPSVFLDWAEGCVTNPLLAFEYFREQFRRNCSKDTQAAGALAAAYKRPWQPFFCPDALNKAMMISPLVAVFAYAVGIRTWQSREVVLQPSVAGYFRSLARRMYRETAQIAERREPCRA